MNILLTFLHYIKYFHRLTKYFLLFVFILNLIMSSIHAFFGFSVFLFIVFFLNLFDGTNVDNSVKHDLMDTAIICHFLPKSRTKRLTYAAQ